MRHPDDPEPIRDSKAVTAYVLGWIALVTGPLLGGVAPAVLALSLARQARADLAEADGWRTGGRLIERGEILARIGLILAALTVCAAVTVAILSRSADPAHDFPPGVD